jgi:predicted DNA binding CopG/RHH family protein
MKSDENKLVLDPEEKEILEAFERGELVPSRDTAHLRAVAKETMKKRKSINIRISEHDLAALQRRAAREGIPYQTLVGSILHKFAVGLMKDVS